MADLDFTILHNTTREVRDEMRAMRSDMRIMSEDMRSIKGHMASFMANETVQNTRLAELMDRMERVEPRLELREAD